MRLIQQGSTGAAQMAFQVCKSLGELAIWLGVQQVRPAGILPRSDAWHA